ncbi:MAG: enhanced serine sensitivity protein SseB C-terminal domain-containing protein [Planctomycetota bacterium]|nr:enhanced serine sensitivity protein SseB C-terminal domain-containing protein [Planctomycetota bacterium]
MFEWLRRRKSAEPPRLDFGSELEFHAAPSGDGERRLTAALARLLAEVPAIQRAYLAHVRYGPDQPLDMALCLVGTESDAAYESIQKLFHALFEQGQHLDIVFIDATEEPRLRSVASPFFGA